MIELDSFGLNVRELDTPNGIMKLTKSNALNFEYKKTMVVIDDRYIGLMEFRPSSYTTDILKDNAYDGRKDEYFSQMGSIITHIKTHSKWYLT